MALLPVDNTVGGRAAAAVAAADRRRPARAEPAGRASSGTASSASRRRCSPSGRSNLASPKSQTGLELGLRLGVGVHAARARFAPFAALSAELVPVPPAVFALPAGTLGHTPLFWIGATAGVSLGFL